MNVISKNKNLKNKNKLTSFFGSGEEPEPSVYTFEVEIDCSNTIDTCYTSSPIFNIGDTIYEDAEFTRLFKTMVAPWFIYDDIVYTLDNDSVINNTFPRLTAKQYYNSCNTTPHTGVFYWGSTEFLGIGAELWDGCFADATYFTKLINFSTFIDVDTDAVSDTLIETSGLGTITVFTACTT
jgi:hypothetical protein